MRRYIPLIFVVSDELLISYFCRIISYLDWAILEIVILVPFRLPGFFNSIIHPYVNIPSRNNDGQHLLGTRRD
jgi:hypothetical protein